MNEAMRDVRDVFVHLGGQDDNLGDSALRAAYLLAARGPQRRFHIHLGTQTSDYVTGLPLTAADTVYTSRSAWIAASEAAVRPVRLFNAGEINPPPGVYPNDKMAAELARVRDSGGTVVIAGVGLRHPEPGALELDPAFRDADLISWRDGSSRDATGLGGVAPDWAFALGTPTTQWAAADARPLLAVSLRFDRAWPDASWFEGVRALAKETSTRIVTVAQVARDAPRAVRIAQELGGEYLPAPSTRHSDLDAHVRAVYAQSVAVVSDRAHALIIGATEGAFPIGSAADPEKLSRMLAVMDINHLTGRYDQLLPTVAQVPSHLTELPAAIDAAREMVADLGARVRAAMGDTN